VLAVQLDQFPNLEGLLGLARNNGVDIRSTLLRVLTDFYVHKPAHSLEEERHYTELALRLIDGADAATRRIVAIRLAAYAAAPRAVVDRFSSSVTRDDDPSASNYFGPRDLSALFFSAAASERRLILLNLDYAPIAPAAPPSEASQAMRRLEATALSRNIGEAVRILEQTFGLSSVQAMRMVQDCSGEPMLVAAKALAMPADMLQRMILFLHPAVGHSVQRIYELAKLYDEMTTGAALRLLAIWRDTYPKRRQVAPALSWNDDKTRARTTMNPQARRVSQYGATRDPNNGRRNSGRV
jgi:hypothetical protein